MTVAIADRFNDPRARYTNYYAYDAAQRTQLALQQHTDLRTFVNTVVARPMSMYDLNVLTMDQLDALTMQDLENAMHGYAETWVATPASSLAVVPAVDRQNFQNVQMTLAVGTTTVDSYILSEPDGGNLAIDISTYANTDYIGVSLPSFPFTSLDMAQSTFNVVSSSGQVAIPLSSSTTVPSADGDCELRFPLSLLPVGVNRKRITNIGFTLVATAGCTFRVLGIRAFASTWQYAPFDYNTLTQRFSRTIPPAGSTATTFAFPARTDTVAPQEPTTFPMLMRADMTDTSRMNDPRPLAAEVFVPFNPGPLAAVNTILLRFREYPEHIRTMSDMDGLTMADLESLVGQPDYDPGYAYLHREDYSAQQFVDVRVQTDTTTNGHIDLLSPDGTVVYTTTFPVVVNQRYTAFVTLEGDSIEVKIGLMTNEDRVDSVVGRLAVEDSSLLRERQGRFGWSINFADPRAWVEGIITNWVTYQEVRTSPAYTHTPVEGARLYASFTGNVELLTGIGPSTWGGAVAGEYVRSKSGHAYRVQTNALQNGVVSAPMYIDNISQSFLSFSVLFPREHGLICLLLGESGADAQLPIPSLPVDHWQSLKLPLGDLDLYSGTYRVAIVQGFSDPATWFLDNLSLQVRAVVWEGRSSPGDAWGMHIPAWVPFNERVNDPDDGIVFSERGNAMQIRGRIQRPEASITDFKSLPKYAELGRMIWEDQMIAPSMTSIADFTSTVNAQAVKFSGVASGSQRITAFYWSFGDGHYDCGPQVSHTFSDPGTYPVTLTVIDVLDNKASVTKTVTV